jgi:hypothetical protein
MRYEVIKSVFRTLVRFILESIPTPPKWYFSYSVECGQKMNNAIVSKSRQG